MDSPRRMKQEEVTGVSRSGRVRKKSSKLMDFESPDEIDIRPNRKKDKLDYPSPLGMKPVKGVKQYPSMKQEELIIEDELEGGFNIKEELSEESDAEINTFQQNEESSYDSLDGGSDAEEMNTMDMEGDEAEGFQAIADSGDELPPQSLYMTEKNKKKLVIKDGKIVGRLKSQRKDKGKTRFTAYLLWAKEIRKELLKANPDLDFTQMSKKLGELWATVPINEKYIWKRRATRMANKAEMEAAGAEKKGKASSPQRKYINKNLANRSSAQLPPFENRFDSRAKAASPSRKTSAKVNLLMDANSAVFKQVGTAPLDVAAHLKLLGESLTIIGERLTEHEGQIAVSGSFSLLLDSLLCALVPLLCLTQQVPELNCISQDLLSQALDNIAYIMPGL